MTLSKVVTDKKFIETREKIRELSPRSHSQINNIRSVHWSEFQFLREGWRRYGVHTSNHVERWNGLLLDYRNQPIHVLVEKIRTVTMDRYKKYGDLARLLQGRVCSTKEWFLQYKTTQGANYQIKHCSDVLFEVTTAKSTHVVDLAALECTCNHWQSLGVPCSHAIKCMKAKGLDPYLSVEPCFSRETLVATYAEIWTPTRSQSQWVENPKSKKVLTPVKEKHVGRPKEKRLRRKLFGKPVERRTCTRCKANDHNIRTCSAPTQQNLEKADF